VNNRINEEEPMFRRSGFLTGLVLSAVYLAGSSALAQGPASPPNFAPHSEIGWFNYSRQFMPPRSGPGPVRQHPDHPFISNDEFRVTGRQPTQQLADLNNPILLPWARDVIAKRNELVLSGKPGNPPHASCWPVGVPGFILRPMTQAMYFIHTPTQVVMILSSKQEVRRIHLNVPHSPDLKPSWYGESVGHYEGDTLVVDTIGIDKRTWVDAMGTPHTDQLHVVERFRLVDGGRELEAEVYVEDPGAFTTPWKGIQRFRQYELAVRQMQQQQQLKGMPQLASAAEGSLQELICADNPSSFFESQDEELPIPQSTVPDF
jgi:hypothetical protein